MSNKVGTAYENFTLKRAEEMYMNKMIMLVQLDDPNPDYNGLIGVVEKVSLDPWGDVRLDGTWAGIGVYPAVDEIKIIEEEK